MAGPADRFRVANWDDLCIPVSTRSDYVGGDRYTSCNSTSYLQYVNGNIHASRGTNWVTCKPEQLMEGSTGALAFRSDIHEEANAPLWDFVSCDADFKPFMGYGLNTVENRDPNGKTWTLDHYDRMVVFSRSPANWWNNQDFGSDINYWGTSDMVYGETAYNISGHIKTPVCNHPGGQHFKPSAQEGNWIEAGDDPYLDYTRGHPYHKFAPMPGGCWVQHILDFVTSYSYNQGNTKHNFAYTQYPWGQSMEDYPDDGPDGNGAEGLTTHNWFDGSQKYYWSVKVDSFMGQPPTGRGQEYVIDRCEFYRDPSQNSDIPATHWIFSVQGAYAQHRPGINGNGEFHLGFNVRYLEDIGTSSNPIITDTHKYNIEIVWSFQDLHENGWGSGAPALHDYDFGEDAGPGEMPYSDNPNITHCRHFWTSSIDTTNPANVDGVVYFGIRPKPGDPGSAGADPTWFRQICVPTTDGNIPPHLKDAP